jgi:MYXO-CTERM domain-containing protein
MSGQIHGVRFVLALGVALLAAVAAAPAHALTCDEGDSVSVGSGTFNDCAGRSVSYNFDGYGISLSHQGTSDLNDWFSDLHISFDSMVYPSGSFENQSEGTFWSMSTTDNTEISFVANQPSDRVDPGDAYSWNVYGSFSNMQSTALVNIRYTMDVPEPGLAILGLGALAGLLLVRRRAA